MAEMAVELCNGLFDGQLARHVPGEHGVAERVQLLALQSHRRQGVGDS